MNNFGKIAAAAGIIAVGIVLSAHLISRFYLTIEREKVITVKGLAVQRIVSDKASVDATLSVQSKMISEGYKELAWQMEEIRTRLTEAGVQPDELFENNVFLNKIYKTNAEGNATNELDYYTISKTLNITSRDVHKAAKVVLLLDDLLLKNFELTISGPFYYVTSIEEAKLKLLASAAENAYQRASLMAANSGSKVGKLMEASQGIFQITEPDSTEVSDYGTYSTGTIEKDIKAVLTLKYHIE